MTNKVIVFHPSAELYGADRMLVAAARALGQSAKVVVVLPARGDLTRRLEAENVEYEIFPRLLVLRKAALRPVGLLRLLWSMPKSLWQTISIVRRHEADACYVSTVTIPLCLVAAWLTRLPACCHVHEAELDIRNSVACLLASPLRLARRVITISDAAEQFVRMAIGGHHITTRRIYNGVAVPLTTSMLPKSQPERLELLLVGRISPRKGTDTAIKALAVLVRRGFDVRLTLVGDVFEGYEWFRAELRQLVTFEDLGNRVVWRDFVLDPSSDYDACQFVIVPSRIEPFGLVAVEARLKNRLVIVSDIPGLRETVNDGFSGFYFQSDNALDLADVVERCYRCWDESRLVAERTRASAIEDFSEARFEEELRSVVAELLP